MLICPLKSSEAFLDIASIPTLNFANLRTTRAEIPVVGAYFKGILAHIDEETPSEELLDCWVRFTSKTTTLGKITPAFLLSFPDEVQPPRYNAPQIRALLSGLCEQWKESIRESREECRITALADVAAKTTAAEHAEADKRTSEEELARVRALLESKSRELADMRAGRLAEPVTEATEEDFGGLTSW